MKTEIKERLLQFHTLGKSGALGDNIKDAYFEYEQVQNGIPTLIKGIDEFYGTNIGHENSLFMMEDLFCQYFILIYKETKKRNKEVAGALIDSFIDDFPDTNNTCIYPSYEELMKISNIFKRYSRTDDEILLWEQSKSVIQAFNELLDKLLEYFIICWRCAQDKKYSTKIFKNTYGSKFNEFKELTNGEDGVFYLLFRIGDPHLRNAITHKSIWFDKENYVVNYTDREKSFSIDFVDFMVFAYFACNFPQVLIISFAMLGVLINGSRDEIKKLPSHIIKLFSI